MSMVTVMNLQIKNHVANMFFLEHMVQTNCVCVCVCVCKNALLHVTCV